MTWILLGGLMLLTLVGVGVMCSRFTKREHDVYVLSHRVARPDRE
jgi:hypothetical protein